MGCRRRAFGDCTRFMGCLGEEPTAREGTDLHGVGRNLRQREVLDRAVKAQLPVPGASAVRFGCGLESNKFIFGGLP